MKFTLLLVALFALLVSIPAVPVRADSHALVSLAVETPIGQTPDRPVDNTPSVIGRLELPKLVGSVGFFVGGTLQAKKGLPYAGDNRAYFGIEAPVGPGLTAYTYAERRFDVNDNRFVAGCRWNLDLKF